MPRAIAAILFLLALLLLFARLGHSALWDDESYTALAGEGVWNTGDTSAVIGQNIVAFRGGELLTNFKDRSTPPLPAYLDAPFVGLFHRSALAARLPFAICGAVLIAFALQRLLKSGVDALGMTLAGLTLISGVAMFLYFRQCRYYALTMLSLPMLADAYWRATMRRRALAIFIWSLVLLGSNYISFIAAGACFAIDYVACGRRNGQRLSFRQIAAILIGLIVSGLPVVLIWNPLGRDPTHFESLHPVLDRLKLIGWFFRDFCQGEFAASAILLLGILLAWKMRDQLLTRALLFIALFLVFIALLSPQSVTVTQFADVRYAAAIIPIALATQWRVLMNLSKLNRAVALCIAIIAVATNVLTFSPFFKYGTFRSTPLSFAREVLWPPVDPFTAASAWIDERMQAGDSVFVIPETMAYPLMFHSPQVTYAWQLPQNAGGQFAKLPKIHFKFQVPPDYVIAFGPESLNFEALHPPPGIEYRKIDTIMIYWHDMTRPEIFGHSFEQVPIDLSNRDAIYVYKLIRSTAPNSFGL